jgi:hypothetical protein
MYINKKWLRFRWVAVLAVILPLLPSFGLHTVVLWVDLKVGMTILWVTYATVRIIDEVLVNKTASNRQRTSLSVQICIPMVLMYFAKAHTSVVYIVTVITLAVVFVLHKQWKLLLSIAFSAVIVLLIRFPGHYALNAERDMNLDAHRYYAGIHDMQATYYGGGDFSDESLALLKSYIPNIDELRDGFRPDYSLRQDWGNVQGVQEDMSTREFIAMYADTFVRNPWQMFRSMLYRSRTYWVIDSKGWINVVNYTAIYDSSTGHYGTQAPEIGVFRQQSFLTGIMDRYISLMYMHIPATFIWRFGIWTALMVISIATLIMQKRYIWIITYIPVFSLLATIFLTSGWTDYRYGLPVFFIGLFLPAVLVLHNPASNTGEANE